LSPFDAAQGDLELGLLLLSPMPLHIIGRHSRNGVILRSGYPDDGEITGAELQDRAILLRTPFSTTSQWLTPDAGRSRNMIVRASDEVLHLITQPDHAALAGRIMRQWEPLQRAERRMSIIFAIDEHDNGWREPDAAPSVDPATGAVLDFVHIPASVRQSVWPRAVARLSRDPWAAALVAQHALTVYDRYRTDPAWHAFFGTLEAARNDLVARTTLTVQQLEQDYVFVRIGDLISLMFCAQWHDETFASWRFHRNAESVSVSPDAFAGVEIDISITARRIPNRPYMSDEDLRHALFGAPAVTLHGAVSGAP
jgi:hypothetical protein